MVRCARCGRELTDPKSIAEGYGPVCIKKVLAKQEKYANQHLAEKVLGIHNQLDFFVNFKPEEVDG